ncbi:MAG TPA: aminoglycoside phosphotransferase family protein [Chlamydiales bacterium]|nr:aminoglycoside phosphotransferase family protein [Chlamydiales bacterium]
MTLDPIIEHFKLAPTQIHPLAGGANNRVYKLEFKTQEPLILKQYFQHPQDQRPRLHAEFSFLQYAWQAGIRNVPQPLTFSSELNAALYSFLPGRLAQTADISDTAIQQMINFFLALNRGKSPATDLPPASESCFTLNNFIQITEKRIDRLRNTPLTTPLDLELANFLTQHLVPKWNRVKENTCKAALHLNFPMEQPLDRCITPSDFGLHNVLIRDNTLFFIDFEYAGWDDPCKTVCDLFCQPRVPIPHHYFTHISEAFSSVAQHPDKCLQRIHLIFPVMQMKWCCILLNAFTHIGKDRRAFSHSDEVAHRESQLKQAKQLLLSIHP